MREREQRLAFDPAANPPGWFIGQQPLEDLTPAFLLETGRHGWLPGRFRIAGSRFSFEVAIADGYGAGDEWAVIQDIPTDAVFLTRTATSKGAKETRPPIVPFRPGPKTGGGRIERAGDDWTLAGRRLSHGDTVHLLAWLDDEAADELDDAYFNAGLHHPNNIAEISASLERTEFEIIRWIPGTFELVAGRPALRFAISSSLQSDVLAFLPDNAAMSWPRVCRGCKRTWPDFCLCRMRRRTKPAPEPKAKIEAKAKANTKARTKPGGKKPAKKVPLGKLRGAARARAKGKRR